MIKPGRNAPCPCGSGKKFKHCCARADADAAANAITDDDRALAYDLLEKISHSRRVEEDMTLAMRLMTEDGELAGPLDNPEDEVAVGRFLDWFSFDVILRSGRTLADEALADRSGDLTPGARRFIADLRDAPWRLLQVETVVAEGDFVCRDLTDRTREFTIFDPWIEVQRHDLLVARLVERDGVFEIEGDPAVLVGAEKRPLLRLLRDLRRKGDKAGAPANVMRMIEGAALLRIMATAEALLDEPLYTAEGDPVSLVTAVFEVKNPVALRQALSRAPDVAIEAQAPDDPHREHWIVENADDDERYPIAAVTLADDTSLRVAAFSVQRAERVRDRLLELAGPALIFSRFESADPGAPLPDGFSMPPL